MLILENDSPAIEHLPNGGIELSSHFRPVVPDRFEHRDYIERRDFSYWPIKQGCAERRPEVPRNLVFHLFIMGALLRGLDDVRRDSSEGRQELLSLFPSPPSRYRVISRRDLLAGMSGIQTGGGEPYSRERSNPMSRRCPAI